MTSSVGRNSLIMATGTAASRVSGQIRTILLAAAVGTTGIAADAYQAGSMIPQVVFTLVSGGIFNAVLVPQIVRTLKEKDAENRLNKLITFAIVLLLGVTALMTAATPVLTRLYANGSPDMIALTNAFTLWCMPQIFFYGLYTVLGQILAAKNHFGMYAWSSVGANLVSCAGFTAFIIIFGKANQQPLAFWTADKITLTAGAWTAGVALQALILFFPLTRLGLKYKPTWGFRGIGLRAMGPVAAWSIGIVIIDQLATIVNTRITTSAPHRANELFGLSQFDVAGNASYQNAYTIYILPYSLIAVSVATAIFPKISQAIADRNMSEARQDLSLSLRNVGLLMCFFMVAFLVMATPITLALLPSVSVKEALLMSGPLKALAIGLPLSSAYLIIQRTFYAFEDGKHPFIFVALQACIQLVVLLIGVALLSPVHWATLLAAAISAGYILAFPILVWMLRKRFEGNLDGRRIAFTYCQALLAGLAALVIGSAVREPIYFAVGSTLTAQGGSMNWLQAIAVCALLTAVILIVYVGVLWLLKSEELGLFIASLSRRFVQKSVSSSETDPANLPSYSSRTQLPTSQLSAIPTYRISSTPREYIRQNRDGIGTDMKPQLGDIVINRYALVSLLREEPGIQAWKANDRVLARDCQLFIVNNRSALSQVDAIASTLALSRNPNFTQVLQLQHCGDVSVVITRLDSGLSLTQYLQGAGHQTLSFDAMRSIIGETSTAVRQLLAADFNHPALTTDSIRITANGIQIADTPLSCMLSDTTHAPEGLSAEQLATRQLAGVLFSMLTRTPSSQDNTFDMEELGDDVPSDFIVLCRRGVSTANSAQYSIPMASLAELNALLGDWVPLAQLHERDIAIPSLDGECSIVRAPLQPAHSDQIIEFPPELTLTDTEESDGAFTARKTNENQANSTLNPSVNGNGNPENEVPDQSREYSNLQNQPTSNPDNSGNSASQTARNILVSAGAALSSMRQSALTWWQKTKTSFTEGSETVPPTASASADAPAQADPPSFEVGTESHQHTQETVQIDRHALEAMEATADTTGDNLDFHAIAAAEMAQIMAPSNPSEEDSIFPPFNVQTNTAHQPTSDNLHPTVQFDFSVNSPAIAQQPGEHHNYEASGFDTSNETGRIPIVDENGFPVEPGSESQRALEEEKAAIALAAPQVLPPSFTPQKSAVKRQQVPSDQMEQEDIADAKLFGGFTTKVVAIAVVVTVVAVALALSLRSLTHDSSNAGISQSENGPWPVIDENDVPFGDSKPSDTPTSVTPSESGTSSPAPDKAVKADKSVKKVPAPKVPENNTPYDIDKQQFLTQPAGQQGYGYYMHLSQTQKVSRFVIKIRSSGGTGYLRANTSSDPTKGEQVAEFTFDASGTTTVKFTKAVDAQDFLLWVPANSLPNNQLYIDSVQLY